MHSGNFATPHSCRQREVLDYHVIEISQMLIANIVAVTKHALVYVNGYWSCIYCCQSKACFAFNGHRTYFDELHCIQLTIPPDSVVVCILIIVVLLTQCSLHLDHHGVLQHCAILRPYEMFTTLWMSISSLDYANIFFIVCWRILREAVATAAVRSHSWRLLSSVNQGFSGRSI